MPTEQKTVTVGIPSFNEEANISGLLQSIVKLSKSMSQYEDHENDFNNEEHDTIMYGNNVIKSTGFRITEVIISDDSSDNTCRIAELIAAENPSMGIRLLHHDTRRGVSAAWNEIFRQATGEIIVLYDADIVIDAYTTTYLVDSIRGSIGLCASNPIPLLPKKSMVLRASLFIAQWLRFVRKKGLSQYTVMGRALSVSAKVAKKVAIPENVIALDLYLQCKVLEQGFNVVYNENAVVYFKPPDNMLDFSSQILRATNGHKQIKRLLRASRCSLDFKTGIVTTLKSIIKNPKGAVCLVLCYLLLPYYMTKLTNVDSVKWHVAMSTKGSNSGS